MSTPSSLGGKQWAARSATTLARRLRRERQQQRGVSRAQALSWRSGLLRQALEAHWNLADRVGSYGRQFTDVLLAAKLLRFPEGVLDEATAARDAGNWARHAPPPCAEPWRALPAGPSAQGLESFRGELFAHRPASATQGTEDGRECYAPSQRPQAAHTTPLCAGGVILLYSGSVQVEMALQVAGG